MLKQPKISIIEYSEISRLQLFVIANCIEQLTIDFSGHFITTIFFVTEISPELSL